jgi:hypothetical protein
MLHGISLRCTHGSNDGGRILPREKGRNRGLLSFVAMAY